ncbi:MAG: hypothetical protein F6K03_00120 [Kamptonema sp. SIO4C4]|nr:hypothetical protein [Kamptonema sp. SIO4C4]
MISLDGDIFYQIEQHCLEDTEFAQTLTTAHYWLIEQLLTRIQLDWKNWLNQLSWGIYFLIIILYNGYLIQQQGLQFLPIFLSILGSWIGKQVLYWCLNQIFILLRRWLFRKLLFGQWSKQYNFKQKLLNLLSRIGI